MLDVLEGATREAGKLNRAELVMIMEKRQAERDAEYIGLEILEQDIKSVYVNNALRIARDCPDCGRHNLAITGEYIQHDGKTYAILSKAQVLCKVCHLRSKVAKMSYEDYARLKHQPNIGTLASKAVALWNNDDGFLER